LRRVTRVGDQDAVQAVARRLDAINIDYQAGEVVREDLLLDCGAGARAGDVEEGAPEQRIAPRRAYNDRPRLTM